MGPIKIKNVNMLLFAALLPGAELWYDCFVCAYDLERTDGRHWQ